MTDDSPPPLGTPLSIIPDTITGAGCKPRKLLNTRYMRDGVARGRRVCDPILHRLQYFCRRLYRPNDQQFINIVGMVCLDRDTLTQKSGLILVYRPMRTRVPVLRRHGPCCRLLVNMLCFFLLFMSSEGQPVTGHRPARSALRTSGRVR